VREFTEHSEKDQTLGFEPESHRFVSTHLTDFPGAPEWILESSVLIATPISSVLDVGCGPGTYLTSIVERFGATTGIGVEPSADAVDLLNHHYADDHRLSFERASAHALPFKTDAFDLVVCWSVLHWVGRNEYLQALGELIRVTRRHLVVMDFVPQNPYRVPYGHDDRYFTYKNDFVPLVLGSGIVRLVDDQRWWDGNQPGTVQSLTEADLEPFLGNELNYHARRGAIFQKDYDALPIHVTEDFAPAVG
jgi:SAM-dependent methyltransferase